MIVDRFPTDAEFDLWLKNKLNVMLIGKHGIGKTLGSIAACKRNKLKYVYLSGPTLDPYINLIGVPKEGVDEAGNPVLNFLLPAGVMEDMQVLIIDEYPRSEKATKNGVMELLQFKSINGRKFPKLRSVIACANPVEEDGVYDGDRMDAAQLDRFHVQVQLPYQINEEWWTATYGKETTQAIVDWWNRLAPRIREACSPRRVEDALKYVRKGGDPEHILPFESNLVLFQSIALGETTDLLSTTIREIAMEVQRTRDGTTFRKDGPKNIADRMAVFANVQIPDLLRSVKRLSARERLKVFVYLDEAKVEQLMTDDKTRNGAIWIGQSVRGYMALGHEPLDNVPVKVARSAHKRLAVSDHTNAASAKAIRDALNKHIYYHTQTLDNLDVAEVGDEKVGIDRPKNTAFIV